MSEDAGAAAGTAEGDTTAQAQAAETPQGSPAAPAPGADDRSAEEMLGEAVGAGDDGAEDPAKALAKAQADVKKWRELSRKNENTAKQNQEAARRLQELEDANKTELQRATDRAVQAEKAAAEAEGRYHRTLAAANHDIPPSLIDLISGSTEDEITASAEALAAAINDRAGDIAAASARANGLQPQRPQSTRPVESLRPGAVPASEPDRNDPNAWIRAAVGRR